MIRKVFGLALVGLVSISVIACGNTGETPDTSEATQAEEIVEETADTATVTDTPEAVQQDLEENTIDFIKQVSADAAPTIDMTDCATFTDLLNKDRVTAGMGYANVQVGDTDCFFVTSGTYDNMDGNMAGIDATIFIYKDGELYQLGQLCSGGTAYPIAVKDKFIYAASNHWVCKYVVAEDKLQIMEKASVNYDSDGNGTYFYESEDGGDYTDMDSAQAEEIMNDLFEEMGAAEIVNFDTVSE